ncbi:unnamed protein product [Ixodes persulcatus]
MNQAHLNTVKPFIFVVPIFREAVTEDIIAATKFREFQTPTFSCVLKFPEFFNSHSSRKEGLANVKGFTVLCIQSICAGA